jgi:hypothetical protein
VPRKVFVAGEILTAADVNTNLMDQAVMVFDDSAARGSAIPSPIEGMVTYLKDTDALEKFDGSNFVNVNTDSGKILQVVSTTKTDTFSTSSTSFTDVTGLTVSITPSSTSSKILILVTVQTGGTGGSIQGLRLLRGATVIGAGGAAGSRSLGFAAPRQNDSDSMRTASHEFLDSPNTTSSLTYEIEIKGTGGAVYVNRSHTDGNNAEYLRTASTITALEVAG